jgi:hypothetical protein
MHQLISLRSRTGLDEALLGARFVVELGRGLRRPIGAERARAILRRRLERREADFLALARRAIYPWESSPYRQLLRLAGCQYGDLERLVQREGVEGALRDLYRRGVYLTDAEFAGRQPVVRGSVALRVSPAACCNRWSGFRLVGDGGAAGPAMPLNLPSLRDHAVNLRLFLEARGGGRWQQALWGPPGGASLSGSIEFRLAGLRAAGWFSALDPAHGLHPRYRWSALALRLVGALAGAPFPPAVLAPPADPGPVLEWLAEVARRGETPHLLTPVGNALRLAQAARQAGRDLRGAQLTVVSEPLTAARLVSLQQAGLTAVPDYGSAEAGGAIGYGCLAPSAPDEVHLCHDLHALIQGGPESEGPLAPGTLLLASLRPTTPFILLNVAIGDRAVASEGSCGCPLERLGWSRRLHQIQRQGKLTAEGLSIPAAQAGPLLEALLPRRFGGQAGDYHLVQDIGEDGLTRFRLLVDPKLGPLDRQAVAEALLAGLERLGGATQVAARLWRQAGTLRVEPAVRPDDTPRRTARDSAPGRPLSGTRPLAPGQA